MNIPSFPLCTLILSYGLLSQEVLKLFAVPEAHGDNGQDVKNDEEDQFGDANMLDEEDFI